jgi:hypothetical protein
MQTIQHSYIDTILIVANESNTPLRMWHLKSIKSVFESLQNMIYHPNRREYVNLRLDFSRALQLRPLIERSQLND